MNNETKLLTAFTEKEFQDELTTVRLSIETELKTFLAYLKTKLTPEQKLFDNIESRVKSLDSFQEKIHRKDYLHIWQVGDDLIANQRLIATNLPDLIGFRINCFFWPDESKIYEILQEYYAEGNFPNFELDFSENKRQKNGHIIYKLTGKYTDSSSEPKVYNFEIQIKSIMHNIWGEVDHKTIFKGRDYDADCSSKKAITEELFHILQSSDKQLLTLLGRKNEEKRLIYALFYNQTKEYMINKCGTDILASHYTAFFEFFEKHESTYNCIKNYVANNLLEKPYDRKLLEKPNLSEKIIRLQASISNEFYEYNLRCIFQIFNLLYSTASIPHSQEDELYENFLTHLAAWVIEFSGMGDDEDDEDDEDNEDFDEFDSDDLTPNDMAHKDSTEDILKFLSERIGGRKND